MFRGACAAALSWSQLKHADLCAPIFLHKLSFHLPFYSIMKEPTEIRGHHQEVEGETTSNVAVSISRFTRYANVFIRS
jgi:hypothetical protein